MIVPLSVAAGALAAPLAWLLARNASYGEMHPSAWRGAAHDLGLAPNADAGQPLLSGDRHGLAVRVEFEHDGLVVRVQPALLLPVDLTVIDDVDAPQKVLALYRQKAEQLLCDPEVKRTWSRARSAGRRLVLRVGQLSLYGPPPSRRGLTRAVDALCALAHALDAAYTRPWFALAHAHRLYCSVDPSTGKLGLGGNLGGRSVLVHLFRARQAVSLRVRVPFEAPLPGGLTLNAPEQGTPLATGDEVFDLLAVPVARQPGPALALLACPERREAMGEILMGRPSLCVTPGAVVVEQEGYPCGELDAILRDCVRMAELVSAPC